MSCDKSGRRPREDSVPYRDFPNVRAAAQGMLYVRYTDFDGRKHQRSKQPRSSDLADVYEKRRREAAKSLQAHFDAEHSVDTAAEDASRDESPRGSAPIGGA